MITVYSLFNSQAEATEALDALAKADFADNAEMEVIEGPDEPKPEAAIPGTQGMGAGAVAISGSKINLDLSEAERGFYLRGLSRGGVMVVAKVDDEYGNDVAGLFAEYGGRTLESG